MEKLEALKKKMLKERNAYIRKSMSETLKLNIFANEKEVFEFENFFDGMLDQAIEENYKAFQGATIFIPFQDNFEYKLYHELRMAALDMYVTTKKEMQSYNRSWNSMGRTTWRILRDNSKKPEFKGRGNFQALQDKMKKNKMTFNHEHKIAWMEDTNENTPEE
jgi:hypothetical protein